MQSSKNPQRELEEIPRTPDDLEVVAVDSTARLEPDDDEMELDLDDEAVIEEIDLEALPTIGQTYS